MKIRLLNDGGYSGLEDVEFPVEVEGVRPEDAPVVDIPASELVRIGANPKDFRPGIPWAFMLGEECEVIEDED